MDTMAKKHPWLSLFQTDLHIKIRLVQ